MTKKRTITNKASNPLLRLGLSPYQVRLWNRIQHRFEREGISIIEFSEEEEDDRYWRCHIDVKIKGGILSSNELNQLEQSEYDRINNDLKSVFTNTSSRLSRGIWEKITKKMAFTGFFIPINELKSIGPERLETYLQWLILQQNYFSFNDYLQRIEIARDNKIISKKLQTFTAIWEHFKTYVNFMKEVSEKEAITFDRILPILNEPLAYLTFQEKLPSEQVTSLLYYICRQLYQKKVDEVRIQNLIDQSHSSVQAFFKEHLYTIRGFCVNGFITKNSRKEQKVQTDFVKMFSYDLPLIKIQDLMDNSSKVDFVQYFLAGLRSKLDVEIMEQPLVDKMKAAFGKMSILDRIRSLSDQTIQKVQPCFAPKENPFIAADAKKWYHLSEEDHDLILEEVTEQLKPKSLRQLESIAEQRMDIYLQNTLNELTSPFLIWEIEKSTVYPQLNLLPANEAIALHDMNWEKRALEIREMAELEQILIDLYERKTVFSVNEYVGGVRGFSFDVVQEKWDLAVSQHLSSIHNNYSYRQRRMEEFGILENGEEYTLRKDIWLDEMLQIEEEIKPYVLYVKEAFQSALPVRRSVEFDPYRHSYDGLEFDPMTIQDQDKWIRGDIMKTLRRRIDRGEIEQINSFCLDTSGSMDHERMRNLFKIIYLMVLGLEDRKSYDSFHFINTYFVEGVNFEIEYTNRKLLFNILRRISRIKKKKHVIYGGHGGTNISEGVQECHARILDFEKKLKDKRLDISVARSLFVITDGEPSMGIVNTEKLHNFVKGKRQDGDVEIKAIYIKPEDDHSFYVPLVFGDENSIEATTFDEAVHSFVRILTQTYKTQRKKMKREKK